MSVYINQIVSERGAIGGSSEGIIVTANCTSIDGISGVFRLWLAGVF